MPRVFHGNASPQWYADVDSPVLKRTVREVIPFFSCYLYALWWKKLIKHLVYPNILRIESAFILEMTLWHDCHLFLQLGKIGFANKFCPIFIFLNFILEIEEGRGRDRESEMETNWECFQLPVYFLNTYKSWDSAIIACSWGLCLGPPCGSHEWMEPLPLSHRVHISGQLEVGTELAHESMHLAMGAQCSKQHPLHHLL